MKVSKLIAILKKKDGDRQVVLSIDPKGRPILDMVPTDSTVALARVAQARPQMINHEVKRLRAEIAAVSKNRDAKYREMRALDLQITALMKQLADADVARYPS